MFNLSFEQSLRVVTVIVALALPAAAETDAQFKLTDKNKKESCPDLWTGIGVPVYGKSAKRDATLVCHTRFVVMHNNATRSPDWVVERLKKSELTNKFNRPKQGFVQEKGVRPSARAKDDDYTNTKAELARGHMAPSEDFNNDFEDMKESFVLSNAVPQVGEKFNGAIWGQLEEEVREAAIARGELFVITGPVRALGKKRSRTISKAMNACGSAIVLDGPAQARVCDANNKKPTLPCNTAGVVVPVGVYKIVYDPATETAYAFAMPNRDHPSKKGDDVRPYLDTFRVSVSALQSVTNVQFLPALPAKKRSAILRKCAPDSLWPKGS